MVFVFQRDYVASNGKGFIPGQELPDGLLTGEQVERLISDGILRTVIPKPLFLEESGALEDPVEALDPEKKSRKRVK